MSIRAQWGPPAPQGTGSWQLWTPPLPAREHGWPGAARGIPQPRLSGPSLGTGMSWGWARTSAHRSGSSSAEPVAGQGKAVGNRSPTILWCRWGRDSDGETPVVSIWYKEIITDFINREEIPFQSYVVGGNSWHLVREVSVHYTFLWPLSPVCERLGSPGWAHAS